MKLPPGPRSTLLATARYLRDPFRSLLRAADKFGDPYTWPTFLGKLVLATVLRTDGLRLVSDAPVAAALRNTTVGPAAAIEMARG